MDRWKEDWKYEKLHRYNQKDWGKVQKMGAKGEWKKDGGGGENNSLSDG